MDSQSVLNPLCDCVSSHTVPDVCWAVQIHFCFQASLLAFLPLPQRVSLITGFTTQGLPGLWSRSLGTPLCAEWGGVGGTPHPPPFVKRKSGCCDPGILCGWEGGSSSPPFLGPRQGQREGVIQLDGMRQRMFKTRLTSVFKPILGLGKGR